MKHPLFELRNESFSYETEPSSAEPALKGINLCVQEGEKIAIIGPSGAGKTSLLHLLAKGSKSTYSFVLQHYALVSELSLFHNVYMGRLDEHSTFYNLLNFIWPQQKDLAEIQPILDRLGLAGLSKKAAGELSGGQQQRVAIARALYRPSKLLFADEPVSSLDPTQASELLAYLYAARETVILSIHSVDLALQNADRILGLKEGQILFDLPSQDVSQEKLAELYSPSISAPSIPTVSTYSPSNDNSSTDNA